MNLLFINGLLTDLDDLGHNSCVMGQDGVKSILEDEIDEGLDNFPMICYEYTEDSDFEVGIDETKFLNDSAHDGDWIMGGNDEQIEFLVNLKEHGKTLEIDCLEVAKDLRNTGIGRDVVECIEENAREFYDKVIISPFDTEAINFWNHMEYVEGNSGYWGRRL